MQHVIHILTILSVIYLIVTIVVLCLGKRQKKQPLSEIYVAQCGHTFRKQSVIKIGLHLIHYTLPKNGAQPLCCPDCFKSSAIHCAGCKGIIVPGDKVCLYGGMTQDQVPKYAHVFDDNPIQLVYCARCADSKDHIIGTWMRGKRIEYFKTARSNIN